MFYDINRTLSEVYTSLNPLNILDFPAEDVFNLINDTIDYNLRNSKSTTVTTATTPTAGGVIRRPAGDDWF